MKVDRHHLVWLAILAIGGLSVECFLLHAQRLWYFGLPITHAELWLIFSRSVALSGPIAIIMLSAMLAGSAPWRASWGLVGLILTFVNGWCIHDVWTEIENPAAASIGMGFMIVLEWAAALSFAVIAVILGFQERKART